MDGAKAAPKEKLNRLLQEAAQVSVALQIEFLGNLFIREIPSPQVQAEDPDAPRWMVTGEAGPGQILEASLAGGAGFPMACRLCVLVSFADHLSGGTMGIGNPVGPRRDRTVAKSLKSSMRF